MGTDDLKLSAPGDTRICDRIQFARIFVQRKFIQQTVAAFARLGIGTAAHGIDFYPACKFKHISFFFFNDLHTQIMHSCMQDICKMLAVIQKKPRLYLIAAGHPAVITDFCQTFPPHHAVSTCPGYTDLTAFFHQFQAGVIQYPAFLIGQKQSISRRNDLCIPHIYLTVI